MADAAPFQHPSIYFSATCTAGDSPSEALLSGQHRSDHAARMREELDFLDRCKIWCQSGHPSWSIPSWWKWYEMMHQGFGSHGAHVLRWFIPGGGVLATCCSAPVLVDGHQSFDRDSYDHCSLNYKDSHCGRHDDTTFGPWHMQLCMTMHARWCADARKPAGQNQSNTWSHSSWFGAGVFLFWLSSALLEQLCGWISPFQAGPRMAKAHGGGWGCLESLQDQDQWWLSGIHRPVELHFVARIASAGAGSRGYFGCSDCIGWNTTRFNRPGSTLVGCFGATPPIVWKIKVWQPTVGMSSHRCSLSCQGARILLHFSCSDAILWSLRNRCNRQFTTTSMSSILDITRLEGHVEKVENPLNPSKPISMVHIIEQLEVDTPCPPCWNVLPDHPRSTSPEDYTTETLLQDAEGLLKISCQLTGASAEAASIRFSLGDLEARLGC